jgi:hypothetical protein
MAQISYRRHRFPPVVIKHAVWLYLRFTLSYRDVEELLAERGLDISYERSQLGAQIRTDDRSQSAAVPPPTQRSLASRRNGRGGSLANICTCDAQWIMKARSSKFWFSATGQARSRQALAHAAPQAGLRAEFRPIPSQTPA